MFLINKNINIFCILLLIMVLTIYIYNNKSKFSNSFSNSNNIINKVAADNLFIHSKDTMNKVDKLLKENVISTSLHTKNNPCMNKLSIISDLNNNNKLKDIQLTTGKLEENSILDNINNISIQNNINKNLLNDDSIANLYGKSNFLRIVIPNIRV